MSLSELVLGSLRSHARNPHIPCGMERPEIPGTCRHCGTRLQVAWCPIYGCSMCLGCRNQVTDYALDGIPDSDEAGGEPETGYAFDYTTSLAAGLDPVAFGPPLWRPKPR